MKALLFFVILLFIIYPSVFSESEKPISVGVKPYGSIPLGSSSELFKLGGGVSISGFYLPDFFRIGGITLENNYFAIPIENSNAVSAISISVGPFLRFPIGDRIAIIPYGGVGYYYWFPVKWDTSGNNGGGIILNSGVFGTFQLTERLSLGLGISYDYYTKLYNGISFSLGAKIPLTLNVPKWPLQIEKEKSPQIEKLKYTGAGIEIKEILLTPVFPVLYKFYDNNPLGTVIMKNLDTVTAENIQLQFFVERYMDNPMESIEPFSLEPGEDREVAIYGIFTEDLMEITEGTKATAKLTLDYMLGDELITDDFTQVIEFYNRNALMWDDDRKVASFITAKDPEILGFAKNVVSWMQKVKNPALDENLQKGMILFEAVKTYGIQYQIDPATPFSEFSKEKTTIDFLQFPRQTLQYTNGDCDDLSVLYTSLLEAVGVETAVITIPGHIYAAFALKQSSEEARRVFSKPDNLIFESDKVWVPVEITMFQESFEMAWKTGAKEWRENKSRDQTGFYPTRESWQTYQAVGFREGSSGIQIPEMEEVTTEFSRSLERYVGQEIYLKAARIHSLMDQSEDKTRYLNRLAVLYGKYGLYDQALESLEKLVEQQEYIPALINLGNIYFLKKEFEQANTYYKRVFNTDDKNTAALLGIARCNHEMENYGTVSKLYKQLTDLDPELSFRFSYLDLRGEEGTRAADQLGLRKLILWEEE